MNPKFFQFNIQEYVGHLNRVSFSAESVHDEDYNEIYNEIINICRLPKRKRSEKHNIWIKGNYTIILDGAKYENSLSPLGFTLYIYKDYK